MNCKMCGFATKNLTNRSYQYDNGEQFVAAVCANCADLHARLTNQEAK